MFASTERTRVTRRHFLRGAAVAGAAAVTAGPLLALARPALAAPVAGPAGRAQRQGAGIQVWRFGGIKPEHAWEKQMADKWNAEHPDMPVTYTNQDWATKREKMIASKQAGQLPDIVIMDGPSIPDLIRLDIIKPIDDSLVQSWAPRFVPEIWATGMWEGKFYAIPTYVDMATMLTYNTDMVSTPPTTWDELKKVGADLKASSSVQPLMLAATKGTNDVNLFEGVAFANGGRWLSEDGTKVVINDQGVVDALQLYVDLIKAGIAEPDAQSVDYYRAIVLFLQGKSAMAQGMSWVKAIDSEVEGTINPPYKLTVFPKNATPSGSFPVANLIMAPTSAAMLTTGSKNEEAALKFLDFYASDDYQAGWDGDPIPGRVPATKKNWESPDIVKVYPDLSELYKAGTLFQGALPMPAFPGITEMETALGEALQAVVVGRMSPKQALDDVAAKSQAVLDKVRAGG